MALRLLREFGVEAKRALPEVEKCLGDEDRLVRLTVQAGLVASRFCLECWTGATKTAFSERAEVVSERRFTLF